MNEPSPLLVDVKFDTLRKSDRFSDGIKNRRIIDLQTETDLPKIFHGVKYAVLWKPDADLFQRLPDLEVIFSAGAGVDHIMGRAGVPDLPIVRFVDPTLTNRMSEWVCLQCLMHLRQQRRYDAAQRDHIWEERPQPEASEITVGIMGLGVLGQDSARKLKALGFNVIGWSRSQKSIDGMTCFDQNNLDSFLTQTQFLVCLLPLTAETRGFFKRDIFEKLQRQDEIASPVFINAGRGGSQVERDIIACLQDGTLGAVSLDVFETEPLPEISPLWDFENAILTPHMAATSDIRALAAHIEHQIARHEQGLPLEHLVDKEAGY
jgi:glyoxylate/hydroxypyruvate reductase